MLRIVSLSLLVAACASDGSAPAAPTNLAVSPLGAGAHLMWKDNSADETEFVIMRQRMGTDTAMTEISRVPFNGTSFHDEPIIVGATYIYMIVATNENGESQSNQVNFVAP